MVKTPKKFIRIFILLIVGLVLALWINVNYDYSVGITFALIGAVTLIIYRYAYDIFNGGS